MKAVLAAILGLFLSIKASAGDGEKALSDDDIIRTAKTFAIGPVGESGATTKAETALRAILKQPDGVARFKKILAKATNEGRLYALVGLRNLDPNAYQAALPAYSEDVSNVRTMQGCMVMNPEMREVARSIQGQRFKLSPE